MAHVRKRQFQPSNNQQSITSFFTRVDPANPPPDYNPYDRNHVPAFAPPLPDPVQSQLMTCGMRIRKSVPEGYKTHKTMPPPSTAPAVRPILTHAETAPASSAPAIIYTKPNELMPMCGLHKVGGFSSQPPSSLPSLPSLNYSQTTISSSAPFNPITPNNQRKRAYEDEIEDELDAIFDAAKYQDDFDDSAISPKTKYPFSHSSMPELNRKSGFVHPDSRPKARLRAKNSPDKPLSFPTTTNKDFDDHDVNFLQPMDCD